MRSAISSVQYLNRSILLVPLVPRSALRPDGTSTLKVLLWLRTGTLIRMTQLEPTSKFAILLISSSKRVIWYTHQTARKQWHPREEASLIPELTNLAACITVANFLTLRGTGAAGTISSTVWLARPFSGPMPDRIVAWMRHSALTIVRVT